MIEGTQPHAPYNVSGTATEFQVTLRWQPGYAGGPDYKQDYTIWYREAGYSEWTKVPVTPSGATSVSIFCLSSQYKQVRQREPCDKDGPQCPFPRCRSMFNTLRVERQNLTPRLVFLLGNKNNSAIQKLNPKPSRLHFNIMPLRYTDLRYTNTT